MQADRTAFARGVMSVIEPFQNIGLAGTAAFLTTFYFVWGMVVEFIHALPQMIGPIAVVRVERRVVRRRA